MYVRAGRPAFARPYVKISISKQLKRLRVLFDSSIGPYQALSVQDRVDPGAMAMKGYSAFLKGPVLLRPHQQIV